MSSARFAFVQGGGLSPEEAAELLSDPSCRPRLEDGWAPKRPPKSIIVEREHALVMIGTTTELSEALTSARRKGIQHIVTSDGGSPAIWYASVATDPETVTTMIIIAGADDFWGRDPLDPAEGWYRLADRQVGVVSIQELRDDWLANAV
jgi:hypothetical protein